MRRQPLRFSSALSMPATLMGFAGGGVVMDSMITGLPKEKEGRFRRFRCGIGDPLASDIVILHIGTEIDNLILKPLVKSES